MCAQKGKCVDAARAAVTALASISKAGLSRMVWLKSLPDPAHLDKVKKSFTCRSLDLLIQFTNICRDWDTVVDILLPLWTEFASSICRPESKTDRVAEILIQFGVMVFDNLSNHGLFPSPEADSWTTGCPEHFRDNRNRVRQVTTPLGERLVQAGFGKALADRIVQESTSSLTDGSVAPVVKAWREWDRAMWKLRCAAHAIPKEVGPKICELLVHYRKANNAKFAFHPLLHGTIVDGIRWTSAWWVSSRDWNKLSIALQVLIEAVPSVTKLSDMQVVQMDTQWFVGIENNHMMQDPLVQASSCAAMTFDHLCSSCKDLDDFPVELFNGLWGFVRSFLYRATRAGQESQYALLAHIRRPVLRGLSKLASRFAGDNKFGALEEITKVAWTKIDHRICVWKDILHKPGAPLESWLVELMRASTSLEAILNENAAKLWRGRGNGAAYLKKYWPTTINFCRVALECVKIHVARPTRFVATSKIDDDHWITALVARTGNLALSLIRFATMLANGTSKLVDVSNVSIELLQVLLQVYATRVNDLPLSIAADLIHLVGYEFRGDTLPRVLESVFAPTVAHLGKSNGPDGAPDIVVAFFGLMSNVCRLCADSSSRGAPDKRMMDAGHQLGQKAAIPMLNAAVLCIESAPQHRAAGESILQWLDLIFTIASTAAHNPLGKAFLDHMTNSQCGQRLTHALFQGGFGTMPAWMVIPVANTIYHLFKCCGTGNFRLWATQSLLRLTTMAGEADEGRLTALVRRNVDFMCKNADDATRFRRAVKAACGGKKKGSKVQQPKMSAGHKIGALFKKKK